MSSDPCCAASLAYKADLAAQHHASPDFEKAVHGGGIQSNAHVADIITRIVNGHPDSQIDELLPWAYAPTQDLKDVA
jgi:hypothetical protein